MIRKIINYGKFLKKVNVIQFFYVNFFCKSIIRLDNSKIIPYKNAVLDIDKSAKIYLSGGDIEIGCDLLRKSKAETRVRLREGAIWSSLGGCKISYGSTLELLRNAILSSEYYTMNSNGTIVVAKKIILGNDIMIGRNVVIYDSDHHQIVNRDGEIKNYPSPVSIGDHVWIASNVLILKGAVIGAGSVVGANATVYGRIPDQTIFSIKQENIFREIVGSWNRNSPY